MDCANANSERNTLHLQNKTACESEANERPAGDWRDEFNPKRQITSATLHCLSLELTLQSPTHIVCHPLSLKRTHTWMQKHTITAAAVIKHTITPGSDWLSVTVSSGTGELKHSILVQVLWLFLTGTYYSAWMQFDVAPFLYRFNVNNVLWSTFGNWVRKILCTLPVFNGCVLCLYPYMVMSHWTIHSHLLWWGQRQRVEKLNLFLSQSQTHKKKNIHKKSQESSLYLEL